MDAAAKHFLQEFGLSCLVENFEDECIDYETLISLDKEDVEKLNLKFGLQKKLLYVLDTHIESLRSAGTSTEIDESEKENQVKTKEADCILQDFSQRSKDLTNDSNNNEEPPLNRNKTTEVTADNSETRDYQRKRSLLSEKNVNEEPPPKIVRNHLHYPDRANSVIEYFKLSYKGDHFMKLYEKGLFNGTVRSNLAEFIIDCEINVDKDPNKVISSNRFLELRSEIVQIFPTEVVSTYYVPRIPKSSIEGAKQPKGKLYDKYTTIIKDLRSAGLRSNEREKVVEENIEVPELNKTVTGDIAWLRRCIEPENEVTERWKHTSCIRLHSLRVTENRKTGGRKILDNVTSYFNEYKALRQPSGYTLLQTDFNYLYEESDLKLIENWSEIAVRIKYMSNVEPIFKDTTEDTVETLNLILKLFGPINVGKWKTSAVDTLSGFLLHVHDTNGIEVAVQRLREKLNSVKKTLQPFPIIVGPDFKNITDSYVYIDTFYYRVDSPLRAVDVCFKAYHALHAFYPHQSTYPWLFLQKAVYGIITKWDAQIPSVEMRIKEYKDLESSV